MFSPVKGLEMSTDGAGTGPGTRACSSFSSSTGRRALSCAVVSRSAGTRARRRTCSPGTTSSTAWRDRTCENQSHRAAALNLVVAAIVLWNTLYQEQAVRALRNRGRGIPDELRQGPSPLGWGHIDSTGDYV